MGVTIYDRTTNQMTNDSQIKIDYVDLKRVGVKEQVVDTTIARCCLYYIRE